MTIMMDNSGTAGGCCVTRYDTEKMDKIMLRFRPIAPKPASTHGGSSLENTSRGGGADTYVKIGSGKRRYVSNNGSSSKRRSKTASPETSLLKRTATTKSPIWLNFNSGTAEKDDRRPIFGAPDPTVVIPPRVTTGTCITLECLTYTMVDVDALGRTDKERVMNLEWDTCSPGLVSDRMSQVTWWNAAFSKMMVNDYGGGSRSSRAWVAMKESVPISARAFSCRVRVEVEVETADTKVIRKRRRMTVPCDVWRMDCGGFAWRLDVKAALSLGG